MIRLLLICWTVLLPVCLATPAIGGHFGRESMPRLESLDVKCGRTGMSVHIKFTLPFRGVIYSKGFYYDPKCIYVNAEASAESSLFSFFIPAEGCGSEGDLREPTKDRQKFIENIIVIQNDPVIQEIWDEARKIRCNWKRQMKKSVSASPLLVEEPKQVYIEFNSNAINTLALIQKGTGPFSAPVAGYIFNEDKTSLVIYIQDNSRKLDVNVVSCVARKNSRKTQLIDAYGCVAAPNLITPFVKNKQPNGIEADIMLYAYLKDMKLSPTEDFQIGCHLEVCDNSCTEACSLKPFRKKRDAPLVDEFQPQNKLVLITKDNNPSTCPLTKHVAITLSLLVLTTAILSLMTIYLIIKIRKMKG